MNNDRVYEAYHGHGVDAETRSITRNRVHWLLDRTPSGHILDLGCSQGIMSLLLAARGDRVTGVDIEDPALEFARMRLAECGREIQDRVTFVKGDAQSLDFPSATFDHAVCGEMLEHVEDPSAAVTELARVVRPGGTIVVSVPFGILPHRDHRRVYYEDSLRALLDPVIELQDVSHVSRHIGAVGTRRPRVRKPAPSYRLSPTELAFRQHEELYVKAASELRKWLEEANESYRDVTRTSSERRQRITELEKEAATLEAKVALAQERLQNAVDDASQLRRERTRLQRARDTTTKKLNDAAAARVVAERAADVAELRAERLQTDFDRATESKRQLAERLEQRAAELEHSLDAMARLENDAREARAQHELKVSELETELERLQAELRDSREHLDAVEENEGLAEEAELVQSIPGDLPTLRQTVAYLETALASEVGLRAAAERTREEDIERLRAELRAAHADAAAASGGAPSSVDPASQAAEVARLREQLDSANIRYRKATEVATIYRERLRAKKAPASAGSNAEALREVAIARQQAAAFEKEANELRERIAMMESSRGWKLVQSYWGLRRRLSFGRSDKPNSSEAVSGEGTRPALPAPKPQLKAATRNGADPAAVNGTSKAAVPSSVHPEANWVEAATRDFEQWRERAAAAPGTDVVFLFSGTIYIQEKRGNRPIRLTRTFLEEENPVFFNYYRWRDTEPLPDPLHPLLYQSPIDLTPKLVQQLLEADYGGKRKLMFASFPHEVMARTLARAKQHDWITIYDARDDWEEFHKVGMAKWYTAGLETYVAKQCDIVSAVSWPLAQKMAALADRDDVHVVPNALDSGFPAPSQPRAPQDPPVVGYFGHLTPKWFDWDLVIEAAKRYPTWRFELAGHQAPDDIQLPDNVVQLGLLGHQELAELSTAWKFALIPFKVSALGDAVDPIKVYEYLHLGLPVLSSYMPQMREYPGVVVTESRAEFVSAMPSMLEMPFDEAKVREWLSVNRWEDRVATYQQLAGELTAKGPATDRLESLLTLPL